MNVAENKPLSSVITADGFKIVDLEPKEVLYVIEDNEVHEVVPSIQREGDNFYMSFHSPERWYGPTNHRGCGFTGIKLTDIFRSKKNALNQMAKSFREKANKLIAQAKEIETN